MSSSCWAVGKLLFKDMVARDRTTTIVYVSIAALASLFNMNCSSTTLRPCLISVVSTAWPNASTLCNKHTAHKYHIYSVLTSGFCFSALNYQHYNLRILFKIIFLIPCLLDVKLLWLYTHVYTKAIQKVKNVCAYSPCTWSVAADHWFLVFSMMLKIDVQLYVRPCHMGRAWLCRLRIPPIVRCEVLLVNCRLMRS